MIAMQNTRSSGASPGAMASKLHLGFVFIAASGRTRDAWPHAPSNFSFGLRELEARGHRVAIVIREERKGLLRRAARKIFSWLLGLQPYVSDTWNVEARLGQLDLLVLVSLQSAIGYGIAWRLGAVRTPALCIAVGYDFLEPKPWGIRKLLLQWLFAPLRGVITFCPEEAKAIEERLCLKTLWARGLPLGIDLEFYSPLSPPGGGDFVLAMGADPSRDFAAVAEIASRLPGRRFVVATTPKLVRGISFPANVQVLTNLGWEESRGFFDQCRGVLVTTRPTTYMGGCTTVLSAGSHGRPAVVDNAPKAKIFGLVEGENALFFERGDFEAGAAAVERLFAEEGLARRLGEGAALLARGRSMGDYACRLESLVSAAICGQIPGETWSVEREILQRHG